MAFLYRQKLLLGTKKCTSQGVGGRSRKIKISMSTMNKQKKRSYKRYRGQGR